jgi:arsenical pump membrane protein
VKASRPYHPLRYDSDEREPIDWWLFRASIAIVVLIRAGLFLAEGIGIPVEALAIGGVLLLLAVRWYRTGVGVKDVFSKTPWHILLFAFSIYVIVTGLQNAGLTSFLIHFLQPFLESGHGHAVAAVGLALTVMSNLVNNLPSVMIGTLALTEMGLDGQTLQLAYLANIIGSDIGALLTPMGTLASLIWMFLLGKNKIAFTWRQYMRTTIVVIPIALLVSLCSLYGWAKWIA